MEERCGILQRKQRQGNVGMSSSSSALWLSEDKGRNEDVPSVVEKRSQTGKLGSRNHDPSLNLIGFVGIDPGGSAREGAALPDGITP